MSAPSAGEAPADNTPLFRTESGGRLHIPPCPYVLGVELFAVSEEERDKGRICSWCQAQIVGEGRTYFETLEEALAFMNAPRAERGTLAALLREAQFDQIYVPFSRAYVAVLQEGKGVAWAGKTYVSYSDRPAVFLPSYVTNEGIHDRQENRDGPWGEMCPKHYVLRSLTGVCEYCS